MLIIITILLFIIALPVMIGILSKPWFWQIVFCLVVTAIALLVLVLLVVALSAASSVSWQDIQQFFFGSIDFALTILAIVGIIAATILVVLAFLFLLVCVRMMPVPFLTLGALLGGLIGIHLNISHNGNSGWGAVVWPPKQSVSRFALPHQRVLTIPVLP